MQLMVDEKTHIFESAYQALRLLGETEPAAATPGIAGLRLLLIDAFGDTHQTELVTQWNAAAKLKAQEKVSVNILQHLALEGVAFLFFDLGMPMEWVKRQKHLFSYMPPLHEPIDEKECQEKRDDARTRFDYSSARIFGNMLLAMAILRGDEASIRKLAVENLSIVEAWSIDNPVLKHKPELDDIRWLRDHAGAMAQWGLDAARYLEFVVLLR